MGLSLDLRLQGDWKRDPAFEKLVERACREEQKLLDDPTIGFTDLPETSAYIDMCDQMVNSMPPAIDTLYVLGIGGSALGTSMVLDAFPEKVKRSVKVIDNVDSAHVQIILETFAPRTSALAVVSKSGSTVEPLALFSIFYDRLVAELGVQQAISHCVLITDPETGALRQLAEESSFPSLPVPRNVGGRFSVLTPVSLFPLMFAGIDAMQLVLGAAKEKREGLKRRCTGAVLDYMFMESGKSIKVVFPYSNRLKTFGDWYLQLFAESLGKRTDRSGRVIHSGQTAVVARGVTDQHSQLQLYCEGPDDKTYLFIKISNVPEVIIKDVFPGNTAFDTVRQHPLNAVLEAELQGTMRSLESCRRPVLLLELAELDLQTVGRLIYLFEMQTAITGHLLNINPFDQPGVEEGKRIAKEILGRPE